MTFFRPDLQKLIKIYHIPTSGTPQSYPASADVTTTGAFYPMDQKQHVLEGGDYQNPHELLVKRNIDVRVGDKVLVTIDVNGSLTETNFYVKKVTQFLFGGMPCKRAQLSTAT